MLEIRDLLESDIPQLTILMNELQDHIVSYDRWGIERSSGEFSCAEYIRLNRERVVDNSGQFLVAVEDGVLLGFIAGGIESHDEFGTLMCFPATFGYIYELCVKEEARGKGVGRQLMGTMEEYFKKAQCDYVQLDVYAPQSGALEFYKHLGYQDSFVHVIKPLSEKTPKEQALGSGRES